VALVLVVIAATLYITPLRAFFVAQDGYFAQLAALSEAQATNRALEKQAAQMYSAAYVVRQVREQWQLVPVGMQAFIVKGLPQDAPSRAPSGGVACALHISLGMRLRDLWRTLRE
jgi:hypothetical protein